MSKCPSGSNAARENYPSNVARSMYPTTIVRSMYPSNRVRNQYPSNLVRSVYYHDGADSVVAKRRVLTRFLPKRRAIVPKPDVPEVY